MAKVTSTSAPKCRGRLVPGDLSLICIGNDMNFYFLYASFIVVSPIGNVDEGSAWFGFVEIILGS